MSQPSLNFGPERKIYSVSELSQEIKGCWRAGSRMSG